MTHPVAHNLALRDVSKHYGSVAAVDRVSLDVPRGQFLTLLGPSGSGKTTLLMIIAGFVEPTAGDVLVDDARITHLPPEKRNFGMVFQGYALFPHLTVFDNVAFPLKVRGVPRADAADWIRGALDLVQLVPLADRYPRQLSGGQQQRVALARALVFTPDILLLDQRAADGEEHCAVWVLFERGERRTEGRGTADGARPCRKGPARRG